MEDLVVKNVIYLNYLEIGSWFWYGNLIFVILVFESFMYINGGEK